MFIIMNFGDVVTLETMCYHFYEIEIAVKLLYRCLSVRGRKTERKKDFQTRILRKVEKERLSS